MFPLKQEQPYPRQQWWAAAYSNEIGREIVGRTILNERIVLYRTEEGEAVALAGYCPHRSFPFELSRLNGDNIQCGYHGFTFDKHGACTLVPSQANVPSNAAVRQYPLEERGGLIWIWTGDKDAADPTLLPDLEAIGLSNSWRVDVSPMVTIKGRYTLLIDNLLDLSHASFIHADTIPGSDKIVLTGVKVTEDERSLCVQRIGKDLPPNPFFQMLFPNYSGPVDQHFDAEYFSPALIRTGGDNIASATGEPLGTINFIHVITPETPTSVHYWVMTTRNFETDNDIISGANLQMGDAIQPQDTVAIEAVEIALQNQASPVEISCRVDTGALKARHRLDMQIKREADEAVGHAPRNEKASAAPQLVSVQ